MIGVDTSNFRAVNMNSAWPELLFGANAPNIIQWIWEASGVVKTATITDGSVTFSGLRPNSEGRFSFDLSIFARAKLADLQDQVLRGIRSSAQVYRIEDGFTVPVRPTFTIFFDDDTSETRVWDFEYYFIPALRQAWNERKASFYEQCITDIPPGGTVSGKVFLPTQNVMLFPGYPVEIPFFHFQFEGVEGMPYRLARIVDGNLIGSVLSIPDTIEHELLSINAFDLTGSVLNIRTSNTGNDKAIDRLVKLHYRETTGYLVRWLNDEGGYSHWVFDGTCLETEDVQDNGSAQVFTPDPFTLRTITPLPKGVQKSIDLSTSGIECWMFEHLKSLQWSRNVFIWRRNKGELIAGGDRAWQAVNVVEFTYTPQGGKVKEVFISLQPQSNYTHQI
jgi:hypothetical protein